MVTLEIRNLMRAKSRKRYHLPLETYLFRVYKFLARCTTAYGG